MKKRKQISLIFIIFGAIGTLLMAYSLLFIVLPFIFNTMNTYLRTGRAYEMKLILASIMDYQTDHNGNPPPEITTSFREISNTGANICPDLVPDFLKAIPTDLALATMPGNFANIRDCNQPYATGFLIKKDGDNHITISAPERNGYPTLQFTSQDIMNESKSKTLK